jgi:hypothetical protein
MLVQEWAFKNDETFSCQQRHWDLKAGQKF